MLVAYITVLVMYSHTNFQYNNNICANFQYKYVNVVIMVKINGSLCVEKHVLENLLSFLEFISVL